MSALRGEQAVGRFCVVRHAEIGTAGFTLVRATITRLAQHSIGGYVCVEQSVYYRLAVPIRSTMGEKTNERILEGGSRCLGCCFVDTCFCRASKCRNAGAYVAGGVCTEVCEDCEQRKVRHSSHDRHRRWIMVVHDPARYELHDQDAALGSLLGARPQLCGWSLPFVGEHFLLLIRGCSTTRIDA